MPVSITAGVMICQSTVWVPESLVVLLLHDVTTTLSPAGVCDVGAHTSVHRGSDGLCGTLDQLFRAAPSDSAGWQFPTTLITVFGLLRLRQALPHPPVLCHVLRTSDTTALQAPMEQCGRGVVVDCCTTLTVRSRP